MSLSPVYGPSGTAGDLLEFPKLKNWFEGIDHDSDLCGHWGHQFSQLSAWFELNGMASLLHLERMPTEALVNRTGIDKEAAQRLLWFVHEDITEIRANRPLHAT